MNAFSVASGDLSAETPSGLMGVSQQDLWMTRFFTSLVVLAVGMVIISTIFRYYCNRPGGQEIRRRWQRRWWISTWFGWWIGMFFFWLTREEVTFYVFVFLSPFLHYAAFSSGGLGFGSGSRSSSKSSSGSSGFSGGSSGGGGSSSRW